MRECRQRWRCPSFARELVCEESGSLSTSLGDPYVTVLTVQGTRRVINRFRGAGSVRLIPEQDRRYRPSRRGGRCSPVDEAERLLNDGC